MNVGEGVVTVSRLERLAAPSHESEMMKGLRELGGTANTVKYEILNLVLDWHDNGGIIRARSERVIDSRVRKEIVTLDIERMEAADELLTYSDQGNPVRLRLDAPLMRIDDVFGADSKRTLNHQFSRVIRPAKRKAYKRRWSLLFWEDAALQIHYHVLATQR